MLVKYNFCEYWWAPVLKEQQTWSTDVHEDEGQTFFFIFTRTDFTTQREDILLFGFTCAACEINLIFYFSFKVYLEHIFYLNMKYAHLISIYIVVLI